MAEYVWNEIEPGDDRAPFESGRLPYRAVVPAGWGVVEFARDGVQLDVFVSANDDQAMSVVFLAMASPRVYEDTELNFLEGKRVESFERMDVAGAEGRLYRTRERRMFGKAKAGLHLALVHGVYTWQIAMEPGKRDAPHEALFRDFLANFRPTEVLLARDDPSGNIWALEAGDCFQSLPLLIEPRKVVEFWGGVDGFEKVSGGVFTPEARRESAERYDLLLHRKGARTT